MTELPDKIKVGWAVYDIIAMDGIRNRLSRIGEFDHVQREIRVENNGFPVDAAETLLHEILHAVRYVFHIGMGEQEEYLVGALSKGLMTIMVDNPDLLHWFDTTIKGRQ